MSFYEKLGALSSALFLAIIIATISYTLGAPKWVAFNLVIGYYLYFKSL